MVTAREAFKLGFLLRCHEENLTPAQIETRIKLAVDMSKVAPHIADKLQEFGKDKPWLTAGMLAGTAMGVPILAGLGGGMLARKLQGNFTDPEDVRKQEMINQLKMLTEHSRVSQSKALGL